MLRIKLLFLCHTPGKNFCINFYVKKIDLNPPFTDRQSTNVDITKTESAVRASKPDTRNIFCKLLVDPLLSDQRTTAGNRNRLSAASGVFNEYNFMLACCRFIHAMLTGLSTEFLLIKIAFKGVSI